MEKQAAEQLYKEREDPKSQNTKFVQNIMPHILNLYGGRATAIDFEIYDPNATFEDPLTSAHGVKQIKSAFYSLRKIFSESEMVEYNIQEQVTAPGRVEILIDNKQHYKIFGRELDMKSLIMLDILDGKIMRHEDRWNGNPLKNRETVKTPLVGRVAEATRRGAMLLTHAMMGFGKDPSS